MVESDEYTNNTEKNERVMPPVHMNLTHHRYKYKLMNEREQNSKKIVTTTQQTHEKLTTTIRHHNQ